MSTTTVLVDVTRLAKLEALEAQQVKDFERVRAKDTAELQRVRRLRYVNKDRDTYNARRRELRKIAKEKKAADALAAAAAADKPPG